MTEADALRGFEQCRPHLRAVAYRMLGSLAEADDAVQETWLRMHGADVTVIDNLAAWLTTVTSRVCLNLLRARTGRAEDDLEPHLPDPVVAAPDGSDPEAAALLGDAVGMALMVVLDTLAPQERVAFVLHDSFAVPYETISQLLDVSPAAARQSASRARRKVQQAPVPERDPSRQRRVVDAFFAAAREGDFDGLLAVLAPDVVLRSDGGPDRPKLSMVLRGAEAVAAQAGLARALSPFVVPVLVNGTAGVVIAPHGRPFTVMAFLVHGDRITSVDILGDPERLARLVPESLLGAATR